MCNHFFCVFFCFFFFFVFWFLGLLFSGSLLAFVQWLNKTKIQKHTKKTKTKKPKKQNKKNKMTRPNSLPLLTPLGCAILFFFVSWFLVFWFVVGFCAMVKQNLNPKNQKKQQKQNDTTQLSATTPPLGCAILFFVFVFCVFCFFVFLVSWFLGVLVFWFLGFLFSGSLLVF